MWTHLRLAGVFEKVVGLALGEFTDCEDPEGDFTLQDVLWGLAAETGLPCVGGLPIGHGAVNVPVALGTLVRLDGGAGTLSFRSLPSRADRAAVHRNRRSPSRAGEQVRTRSQRPVTVAETDARRAGSDPA